VNGILQEVQRWTSAKTWFMCNWDWRRKVCADLNPVAVSTAPPYYTIFQANTCFSEDGSWRNCLQTLQNGRACSI